MSIDIVYGYELKAEVKALFTEYTDFLVSGDNEFRKYLEIQKYDHEVENLEEKYGLPFGRLYVAYFEDEIAGCIALRKLNDSQCEMKRLYVKPQFRNKGIAKFLVEMIVSDAKVIGYDSMLLDTLPFLTTAIEMYKKIGFYEIGCYNDSPLDNTIYMKLDLKDK
jgi:ribosomal protein S18 acetylase RimI-like enzyme